MRPASNPTTVSPPIRSTGVDEIPFSSSSFRADSSALMSFSSYPTPFSRRNSFARLQAGQPGWV